MSGHGLYGRTIREKDSVMVCVFSEGYTKPHQTADVSWNKRFKVKCREFYDDLLVGGQKFWTSQRPVTHPRSLPKTLIVEWAKNHGIQFRVKSSKNHSKCAEYQFLMWIKFTVRKKVSAAKST